MRNKTLRNWKNKCCTRRKYKIKLIVVPNLINLSS